MDSLMGYFRFFSGSKRHQIGYEKRERTALRKWDRIKKLGYVRGRWAFECDPFLPARLELLRAASQTPPSVSSAVFSFLGQAQPAWGIGPAQSLSARCPECGRCLHAQTACARQAK